MRDRSGPEVCGRGLCAAPTQNDLLTIERLEDRLNPGSPGETYWRDCGDLRSVKLAND